MNINLTIRGMRPTPSAAIYGSARPGTEEYTVASIDGEMDRATLAATLRAIAEGIDR